jgi:3',5'-cyclic AMP phosphodiesterase CpdA
VSLIQSLPEGPLDIVGDIHGEYAALCDLLGHLGYTMDGQHPQGRSLVFLGDFCDRGHDSPAVLALVQRLVAAGRAVAVLGNHEVNLLCQKAKEGSGWYFDERLERDQPKYAPYVRVLPDDRCNIEAFLASLPIGLERGDLRVIHAAWLQHEVGVVRGLPAACVRERYEAWELDIKNHVAQSSLAARLATEEANWAHGLEQRELEPPFMHALAECEVQKQMLNPLKVLTSGVERKGTSPFFSSGKWRFVERVRWWDEYQDDVPVVVGHYWRRIRQVDRLSVGKGDPDLFEDIDATAWHGARGNVFCVDFSVGGRWRERKDGKTKDHDFKLAALRWPEQELVFDDGHCCMTQGLGSSGQA